MPSSPQIKNPLSQELQKFQFQALNTFQKNTDWSK